MTSASGHLAAGSAGPTGNRYTAPDFSVANLLLHRETQLSWVFAHLLDPNETHAQGDTFLALLLEELCSAPPAISERAAEFRSPPGPGSEVATERWTDDGKSRIDIVIRLEDGRRIAIENKPWAWDQKDQVERYLRYLRSKSESGDKSFLLLYWNGNGSAPTWSNRREKWMEKRCITMPYRVTDGFPSVEGWLGLCVKACKAEPVELFLNDLIEYVRRWFPDETHRLEEKVARLERDPWKLVRNPKGWLFRPPCWGDGEWSGVWIYRSNQNLPRFEVGASDWPDDARLKNDLLNDGAKVVGNSNAWHADPRNRTSEPHVSWTFEEKVFLEGHPAEGIDEIMKLAKALMNAVPAG